MKKSTKFLFILSGILLVGVGVFFLLGYKLYNIEGNEKNDILLKYELLDNGTYEVTGVCTGGFLCKIANWRDETVINIPSEYNGKDVTSIKEYAFECQKGLFNSDNYSKVKEIIIPRTVEKIGEGAFKGNDNLEKIEIPSKVEEIADETFMDCKSIKIIKLPDGVEKIGDKAFYNCSSMDTIQLCDNIEKIGGYAFYGCEKMEFFKLPNDVLAINEGQFENCISLKEIVISNKVEFIDSGAFAGCKSLKKLFIPKNVEIVGTIFKHTKKQKSNNVMQCIVRCESGDKERGMTGKEFKKWNKKWNDGNLAEVYFGQKNVDNADA